VSERGRHHGTAQYATSCTIVPFGMFASVLLLFLHVTVITFVAVKSPKQIPSPRFAFTLTTPRACGQPFVSVSVYVPVDGFAIDAMLTRTLTPFPMT
jgi:hypothetical protein